MSSLCRISSLATDHRMRRPVRIYLASLAFSPILVHSSKFPSVDWQLWTAATVTNETLRSNMISLVKKYASSGLNNNPFPDRYNSANGRMNAYYDRSVVGGHFALVRRSSVPYWRQSVIDFSLELIMCSSSFLKSKGAPTMAAVTTTGIKVAVLAADYPPGLGPSWL